MTGRRSLARALVAAIIAGAFALSCGDAFAASISLSARPIALDPADRTVQRVGRLHFLGGLDLRSAETAFGGLSGLSVTADGRLTAVTDRGHWFTARVVRDRTGRLVDLVDAALGPLLDTKGRPVTGEWRDAEALERLPGGDWLVSFEGRHRVWRYAAETGGLQGRPVPFPTPKGVAAASPNGGLEALTPLSDGRILLLAGRLQTPRRPPPRRPHPQAGEEPEAPRRLPRRLARRPGNQAARLSHRARLQADRCGPAAEGRRARAVALLQAARRVQGAA